MLNDTHAFEYSSYCKNMSNHECFSSVHPRSDLNSPYLFVIGITVLIENFPMQSTRTALYGLQQSITQTNTSNDLSKKYS